MNLEQAKERVSRFMGENEILTFSLERFEDDEWVARCNEIPAISTSGFGDDMEEIESLMKDAIFTAAGVEGEFADDELLKDVSIKKSWALAQ